MEGLNIQDISSFQKLLTDVRGMKSLKVAVILLKPLLRLLKIDVDQMEQAFTSLDDLERQIKDLSALPDRFNNLFGARGWIIYDMMNIEVVKAAVEKAEAGNIDRAETDLVAYYDPEKVEWHLRMMAGIEAFRPRMALAQKALIDYREERYHASVPVVLALLDGFVSELHKKRRGFFAEDVDLSAWDSIAAHNKGLNALTKIFQTGRRKTITEQITIPYRNGILHGMDLGYDNKIVAAKTWAALFATRDWALKAEQGLLTAPPPENKTTWKQLVKQILDNAEDKKRLEEWKPRTIRIGIDIPNTGSPESFQDGTPEHKLAEYMSYWQARNYGRMAQSLYLYGTPPNKAPLEVRENYATKKLKTFEFIDVSDEAAAVTIIKTKLVYEQDKYEIERVVDFRLISKGPADSVAIRGKPNSSWVIYTFYV